jgi:hypothetical protein
MNSEGGVGWGCATRGKPHGCLIGRTCGNESREITKVKEKQSSGCGCAQGRRKQAAGSCTWLDRDTLDEVNVALSKTGRTAGTFAYHGGLTRRRDEQPGTVMETHAARAIGRWRLMRSHGDQQGRTSGLLVRDNFRGGEIKTIEAYYQEGGGRGATGGRRGACCWFQATRTSNTHECFIDTQRGSGKPGSPTRP